MSLPASLTPETHSVGMGMFFAVYYFMNLSGPWLTLAEQQSSSDR